MKTDELRRMAQACKDHLPPTDYTLVGLAAVHHGERMADLLSERGGEKMDGPEFAQFVLQCARRIYSSDPS